MKLFLAILAVMFFIIPAHNLRAQGTQGLNIERMAAQQKHSSGHFFNKQSQRNSGLNKKTAPYSQVYYPDSLTLYSMEDSILITASYDQTGSTTQRLVKTWVNGNWRNYMLDTYTDFGSINNNDLEQMWLNGQWTNIELDSSTYDARGNMLVHLSKYWSQGAWKDSLLSSRIYDANGNMLTNVGWVMENNQWMNSWRGTYTYDTSGNELTFGDAGWSNGQWVNMDMWTYTYDRNGHMLTFLSQVWYQHWENAALATYTYDANGNMLSYLSQYWANGQWTNSTLHTYAYDANGRMHTDLLQGWTNETWMNGSITTYTYDTNGNLVNEIIQEWLNGLWTNYRQSSSTYDAHGNELTGNNTMWSGSSWVPTDYNFPLAVNGSTYDFTGYRIIVSWILANATDVSTDRSTIVKSFSLSQNYPNPFNPSTTISFRLPSKSFVSLKVFDIMGREVATIVSGEMPAGSYSQQWNASNMSSGIYFYRLQAGTYLETKKLILLK